MHIGLFGYSRDVGRIKLPRVITFCASLYSIGLPPEALGLASLTPKDIEFFEQGIYRNFAGDISSSLQYVNLKNIKMISPGLAQCVSKALDTFGTTINESHLNAASAVMDSLRSGNHKGIHDNLLKAGTIRRFLG